MEQAEEIKEVLNNYMKEITFKDISNLTSDTMIFVEGILDSMGFVLLVDFLEEKFKVTAEDNELIEANFESIDAITEFILNKQSEAT